MAGKKTLGKTTRKIHGLITKYFQGSLAPKEDIPDTEILTLVHEDLEEIVTFRKLNLLIKMTEKWMKPRKMDLATS